MAPIDAPVQSLLYIKGTSEGLLQPSFWQSILSSLTSRLVPWSFLPFCFHSLSFDKLDSHSFLSFKMKLTNVILAASAASMACAYPRGREVVPAKRSVAAKKRATGFTCRCS
jgi:hypothetical protein